MLLIKAKEGLVAVKKKTKTGATITFWVRPDKQKDKATSQIDRFEQAVKDVDKNIHNKSASSRKNVLGSMIAEKLGESGMQKLVKETYGEEMSPKNQVTKMMAGKNYKFALGAMLGDWRRRGKLDEFFDKIRSAMGGGETKSKEQLISERNKLYSEAMKMIANSPKQLAVRKEIDAINKQIDALGSVAADKEAKSEKMKKVGSHYEYKGYTIKKQTSKIPIRVPGQIYAQGYQKRTFYEIKKGSERHESKTFQGAKEYIDKQ